MTPHYSMQSACTKVTIVSSFTFMHSTLHHFKQESENKDALAKCECWPQVIQAAYQYEHAFRRLFLHYVRI